ncbi:hypothetical protein RCL1_004782 [Eukaryota sp. TZLM3-RCL]
MDNNTVARKAEAAIFLSANALNEMERDLRVLTSVSVRASILVRHFIYSFPQYGAWATQQQFWECAFDMVQNKPVAIRAPFNRSPNDLPVFNALLACSVVINNMLGHEQLVYAQLQSAKARAMATSMRQLLADGPVTWKKNFYRTMSQVFDCPKPSKYAGQVLSNRVFTDDLVDWTDENHDQISNQLELVLGGPDALARFDFLINQPEIALTFERSQFILECGLLILEFLEMMAPVQMRRHAISPIASWSIRHVNMSKEYLNRLLRQNPNQELLKSPYRHFHMAEDDYPEYAIQSDGLSITFLFRRTEKVKRKRLKGPELKLKIEQGTISNFDERFIKRKKNLQSQAVPIQRPQQINDGWRGDDWAFFIAIDPNHTNLCGYSCAISNGIHTRFVESNLVWAAGPKKLTHPAPLNQLTPNVYTVGGFLQYVHGLQQAVNQHSVIQHYLERGRRRALRRNRFDFWIRKQKRFDHLWRHWKSLAGNLPIHIWFGSGGNNPSRQRVKVPRLEFMGKLKKKADRFRLGDEYNTSKKTNCHKVDHSRILVGDEEGVVRELRAYFDCPVCHNRMSRDISASRNQLEIAIEEYYRGERPEAFRRR